MLLVHLVDDRFSRQLDGQHEGAVTVVLEALACRFGLAGEGPDTGPVAISS